MNTVEIIKNRFSRGCCNKVAEDEKNIWFSWYSSNGIVRVDKEDNRCEIVASFERYPKEQKLLYYSVEKIGELLIFAPSSADAIAIYDIQSGKVEYVEIIEKGDGKEIYGKKFTVSFSYENYVYMLPINYPAIIKLNVITRKCEYIESWYELVNSKVYKDGFKGYWGSCIVEGNYAWIVCASYPLLARLNLKNDTMVFFEVKTNLDGFWGILKDGDDFWLTARGKKSNFIVKWNYITKKTDEIVIDGVNKDVWDPFHSPIKIENKLFLFPISESHVYCLSLDSLKSHICEEFDSIIKKDKYSLGQHYAMNVRSDNNNIEFISGRNYKWYTLNGLDEKVVCEKEYMINNVDEKLYKSYFTRMLSNICLESTEDEIDSRKVTLELFLSVL